MIVKCDKCGTHVMPTRDGVCPSCRSLMPQALAFDPMTNDDSITDDGDGTSNTNHSVYGTDTSDTLMTAHGPDVPGTANDVQVPISDSEHLVRFREAWRSGVPQLRDFLPVREAVEDESARFLCLIEFIEYDLLSRWSPDEQSCQATPEADALSRPTPNRLRLQDYVDEFPELGTMADLPARLMVAEFGVRLAAGERPQLDHYTKLVDAARIPGVTDALVAMLNEKFPRRPVLCHGFWAAVGRSMQVLFFCGVIGRMLRTVATQGDSLPAVFPFVVSGLAALFVALLSMGKFHPHEVRRVLGWKKPTVSHAVISLAVSMPLYLLASSMAIITLSGSNVRAAFAIDWSPYYQAYAELAREPMWVLFLAGCLLPALTEEIFFRAFMGRGLIRAYGTVGGVLLTSLFFGLFHVRPGHVVFAFFFGIALHCVYLTTKSIFAPMLLHAVNNLFAFTELRWIQSKFFDRTLDDSSYIPLSLLLISIVTTALLAQLLRKSQCRWVVAGSHMWTPGFVSAEMPPDLLPAEIVSQEAKPSLKTFATVSYIALLIGIGITMSTWIGLTHANAALDQVDSGNIDLADQSSQRAVEKAPHLAWTHSVRAFVQMQKLDFSSAKEQCALAMKLGTQTGLTYRVLGWIAYQEHQNQVAVDNCSKAIHLNNEDAFALGVRGAAKFALNDLDSAILDTSEAIGLDPTVALPVSIRGAARTERGQLEPANKDLSLAIELDPSSAFSWSYRARVCYERKDFSGAIHDAGKALELQPDDGHSHYYLGLALKEGQQFNQAIESFSRFLEINDGDDGIRKVRAELQIQQQRAPEGVADLNILIQRYAEDEQLYFLRSQAFRQMRDYAKAIADLSKAIELKPNFVSAYRSRAEIFQESGQQSKAEADLSTADELERRENANN